MDNAEELLAMLEKEFLSVPKGSLAMGPPPAVLPASHLIPLRALTQPGVFGVIQGSVAAALLWEY